MRAVGEGGVMVQKGGRRRRKVQSACIHLVHLSLSGSPCEEGDSHRVFEENKMSCALLLAFNFWQKSKKNQSKMKVSGKY